MTKKRITALLPMKAHSERVSGKNFRDIAGKPLYRWILDNLLELTDIDQVVINTDARAELEKTGFVETERALIRERKPELTGDFVSMNLLIADDVQAQPSDIYLMTHTTNPLLSAATIKRALQEFQGRPDRDSLFTVNRWQTRLYDADGAAINHDPANLLRTQDLDPIYEENSCLYIFTADSFAATGARIGQRPILFPTPRLEAIDIDDAEDWILAEALLSRADRGATS